MNIALVCNEYPPQPHGGIGTFTQQHARALARQGHRVMVVGWGCLGERWRDENVEVVTLPEVRTPKVGWLLTRLRLRRFLMDAVARREVDLVETPEYLGALPFGIHGCPVVVRLHLASTTAARMSGLRPRPVTVWCERNTLRRNRNWIAVSKYAVTLTRQTFPGIVPERRRVVYNGIPDLIVDEPAKLDVGEYLLYAGHVSVSKGAVRTAYAMKPVLERHPNLNLVYAGRILCDSGCDVSERIRRILGPDLSRRCHFLGFVDHARVLSYMRAAKAFVYPSEADTFGLVVAEAMLQRCAVVASSQGPFGELISDGTNGLLADHNQLSQFTAAVERLLADRCFAQEVGGRARDTILQQFSLDRQVSESVEFYDQCVTAWRGKRGCSQRVSACAVHDRCGVSCARWTSQQRG